MKKYYLKPEIAEHDVMPCEILAGSDLGGTSEKLTEEDDEFSFETSSTTQE